MADTQHLPGYCLLVSDVDGADHLTDLSPQSRAVFLADMVLLGEAVMMACLAADPKFRRVNYEILGNALGHLHAHVHARYEWEPDEYRTWPVWGYPERDRRAPEHIFGPAHEPLRDAIAAELRRLAAVSGGVA